MKAEIVKAPPVPQPEFNVVLTMTRIEAVRLKGICAWNLSIPELIATHQPERYQRVKDTLDSIIAALGNQGIFGDLDR